MDKSLECNCGNNLFWFFQDGTLRCNKCYAEYRYNPEYDEIYVRLWNGCNYGDYIKLEPRGRYEPREKTVN